MNDAGLPRDKAWELLTTHLETEHLIKHCLATEAIMRALAPRFNADPEAWGVTGLIHDIDLDMVEHDPKRHAVTGATLAEEAGMTAPYAEAIRRHNGEELGLERQSELDFALAAAETITGLITATALVYPDKKLASVKSKSVSKRFKSARFAAGANRDIIMECEKIGIGLDDFINISLEAMRGVADDLGL